MDATSAVLAVIIIALALVAVFLFWHYRTTTHLQSRFGPEYSRTVEESGSRRAAEERLRRREKRVHSYEIRSLPPNQRARYIAEWRTLQGEFVDSPKAAVTGADRLLGEVMNARGYPVSDFERQAADLSVEYPIVVQSYRAAHDIALRHERGRAGTEELRRAMVHYRELFDELIGEADMSRLRAVP
jgi:hypothetical protein